MAGIHGVLVGRMHIPSIPITMSQKLFDADSKDIIFNPDKHGSNEKPFEPVDIPDDAIADDKIFPGRVLSGYHAPITSQIAWEAYLRAQAQDIPAVTGFYWCNANNSGSTGGRYWFGYLFGGGPIDSSDFVRDESKKADVTGARAFTIVVNSEK